MSAMTKFNIKLPSPVDAAVEWFDSLTDEQQDSAMDLWARRPNERDLVLLYEAVGQSLVTVADDKLIPHQQVIEQRFYDYEDEDYIKTVFDGSTWEYRGL